jgi:hypothetical protein
MFSVLAQYILSPGLIYTQPWSHMSSVLVHIYSVLVSYILSPGLYGLSPGPYILSPGPIYTQSWSHMSSVLVHMSLVLVHIYSVLVQYILSPGPICPQSWSHIYSVLVCIYSVLVLYILSSGLIYVSLVLVLYILSFVLCTTGPWLSVILSHTKATTRLWLWLILMWFFLWGQDVQNHKIKIHYISHKWKRICCLWHRSVNGMTSACDLIILFRYSILLYSQTYEQFTVNTY